MQKTHTQRGRGFASMSAEERRRIATMGGKAAHAQGSAHKWDSASAAIAGKKGGRISRRRSKWAISQDGSGQV